MTDAAFIECEDCLCSLSRTTARAITSVYDRMLRPMGLRSTQFTLLATLAGHGEMTMTSLANALGMDRTTLTRNLAPLESRGWVKVDSEKGDARTRVASATAKGHATARKALPLWRKAQVKVTAALGTTDIAALHRLATIELT